MKKHIRSLLLCSMLSSAFIANAFAMGDSGCGLGSLIFKSNTKLLQLFAVTTNGSFGSQTFGITTGTSNCTAHGLVMREKEQIYYVEANYKALSTEMAQGKGENLMAFAQVMGCSEHATAEFGQMTKVHYEELIPSTSTTPSQMLDAVKKELKTNPVLSKECNAIS